MRKISGIRKSGYVLMAVLAAVLLAILSWKPALIYSAKQQVRKVLPGSTVSIDDMRIQPGRQVSFFRVKVSKPGEYEIDAAEVGVSYDLASLSRKEILGVALKDGRAKFGQLEAEGVVFEAAYGASEGIFAVKRLKYNNLAIEGISGHPRLTRDVLYLDDVNARLFGGSVNADAQLRLRQPAVYEARCAFFHLDIAQCIRELEWEKKVEMTGTVSGDLAVRGTGGELALLSGRLRSQDAGGRLVIKDTAFLKNLAERSGQPMDLLMENIADYEYNKAYATAELEDGAIVFKTLLDGAAGKRDFTVTLHDAVRMEAR